MVKFSDIVRTAVYKSNRLCQSDVELLQDRAVFQLLKGARFSVVIIPLGFLLATVATGYSADNPWTMSVLSVFLAVAVVLRIWATLRLGTQEGTGGVELSGWLQLFFFATLGMAALWGLTAALFICTYVDGFPVMLVLVLSVGIGAGGAVSFCIWRVFAWSYLLFSLVPGILAGLWLFQLEMAVVVTAMVLLVFYIFVLIRYWNVYFWTSHVTAYLFEEQAKNLSITNMLLVEAREKENCTQIELRLANEGKSEFFASMSHELRTPMHSILSFARLGLKRIETGSRGKLASYLEMIITSGDQLLKLLNDLLALSTLETAYGSYNMREHDLTKDIESIVSEFYASMSECEILLVYNPPGFAALAIYDQTKLYQVLRNLLSNAMKFSGSGGDVRVVLEHDFLDIDGNRQPAFRVKVMDQGIGIADGEFDVVFGKFVRGSKMATATGGVGLGLSICKQIIEDHGGIIWAEQNRKNGTVVCFVLPAPG